jgi:hypothetical protein
MLRRVRFFAAASAAGAQQRLFDVLRRYGQDLVRQYCVDTAATYEADVAEILPTVSLKALISSSLSGAMSLCQSSQSWQPPGIVSVISMSIIAVRSQWRRLT